MRRSTTGMLATSALLGVALLVPTPALAVDGEFSGSADATQLYVDTLNFGAFSPDLPSLAELSVASTDEQVDTAGLEGDIETRAFGQNLSAALGGQELPLEQLSVEQTAPPDNPESSATSAIDLDQASPLLTGDVLESTAWARDPALVQCPDQGRTTLSESTSTTSDLGVLDLGEFQDGMGALISVQAAGQGTLQSASGTYVGPGGALISDARAQSAAINIADELVVEVLDPTLTATAIGETGGASVEYTGQVLLNDEELVGVSEPQTIALTALEPALAPLDELLLDEVFGPLDEVLTQALGPAGEALGDLPAPLGDILNYEDLTPTLLQELIQAEDLSLEDLAGFLEPTVRISVAELQQSTEDDGTHASGSVSVVKIELTLINTLADTTDPLLTVDLMPLAASATVPDGGLDCGAEDDGNSIAVRKDASSQTVRSGESFDYQITVENRGSCPLQNVTVTEEVFLNGAPFTDTITADGATSNSGGVVTFERDSLAPGEIATYTLTIDVPSEANGTFLDEVTADGVCDQEDVTATDVFSGPGITSDASDEGCDVSTSSKQATHREVRPGQQYAYVLRVANTGGEDCGETTVTDTLPPGVGYESCAPSDCDVSGRTVTFVLTELPAGSSEVLTITVTAPDDADADIDDNVALIEPTADTGDPVTIDSPSPDITDTPVFTNPDLGNFVPDQTGQAGGEAPTSLPRTGGGAAMLALGALAAAGALRRRS